MYQQLKQKEAHPMEKYIGRLAKVGCGDLEVVGYSCKELEDEALSDSRRLAKRRLGLVGAGAFRRRIQRMQILLVC